MEVASPLYPPRNEGRVEIRLSMPDTELGDRQAGTRADLTAALTKAA